MFEIFNSVLTVIVTTIFGFVVMCISALVIVFMVLVLYYSTVFFIRVFTKIKSALDKTKKV